MTYPETRRRDVVEAHFGERIADPYRWLENDARTDPDVAAWAGMDMRRDDGTATASIGT